MFVGEFVVPRHPSESKVTAEVSESATEWTVPGYPLQIDKLLNALDAAYSLLLRATGSHVLAWRSEAIATTE